MENKHLYRYTSKDEGIWSAGKRLLPENLIEEANEQRKWLTKPNLPKGNYIFYMTEKGKEKYDETLLTTHKKYLSDIKQQRVSFEDASKLGKIVYEDEDQIVIEI